jgi:hypothetical protein
MVMPVRPEPVPPGQATVRPSPSPNGAEAGARHPLTDHQREDSKVASREQPEAHKETRDTYGREAVPREGAQAMPARIGEELDVYV